MDNPAEQILSIVRKMPTSRKIIMGAIVLLVILAFSSMFFINNKKSYKPLYRDLSTEDAAAIVEELKKNKVGYEFSDNGTTLSVSSDQVYDARLQLASAGLPKGSGVGFEIFDKTDFGTTEFVQKLNLQRALQGELSRTIKEFDEVLDARVMIVMPKDSVFVEEAKPPSASVLLRLRSKLSKSKIQAVLHLVSSSIEALTPDLVSIVDTAGNVLSKGTPDDESEVLANTQLEYKKTFERDKTNRIQSMLEKIVGEGKAIVRVSADMDFSQVDTSEERYDPDGQVVRSRQNTSDRTSKKNQVGKVSTVNPVVPPGNRQREISEERDRKNDTVNYEINKTLIRTKKPLAIVTKLSVAAVLDGTYTYEKDETTGKKKRIYHPRTPAEIENFQKIVQNAMGYSADREDQITVESFAFSIIDEDLFEEEGFNWSDFKKEYGQAVINIFLVICLFLFVVRPIIKTIREIYEPVEELDIPIAEEEDIIIEEPPKPKMMSLQEKAIAAARTDIDKTANIIRGWISEAL